MLKNVQRSTSRATSGRFAIIASRYNARYVDAMLRGARQELKSAGAEIKVLRVPGAFEIPVAAARLLHGQEDHWSGVICLGVVLQGETEHARLVAEAVTQSLAGLQMRTLVPVIHEVLLLETREQAEVRCRDPRHNRGVEAAQTALVMGKLFRELPRRSSVIGA